MLSLPMLGRHPSNRTSAGRTAALERRGWRQR